MTNERLHKKRIERLETMMQWRIDHGTTSYHEAEAEALRWAVEQLRVCLEGDN